ncbi:hypothetical protein CTM45_05030 [Prevotella intermedia]|uniref:Uncharacterized protein n=1 Tax=Prevotella intermedia TaxID=28131 RepID=A0A2D3LKJ0_PREIN|nr:hypothetical protein CTM46_06070 [Prevotella intermedia]PJI22703.1 hypothetical protein CTM45_05030 [Prevotella intermedia]
MHNHLVINALQNLLFCIPKVALLPTKSGCFASQNSRFRNVKTQIPLFKGFIFTKTKWKSVVRLSVYCKCRLCYTDCK